VPKQFIKSLRWEHTKDGYKVTYGGFIFLQVKKKVLETFLADLGVGSPPVMEIVAKKKKPRKKKVKVDENVLGKEDKIRMRAIQLSSAYTKEQKAFYHSATAMEIRPHHRLFCHFKKAIPLLEKYEVKSYKKWIRAQVYGLKFIENGKGHFPEPVQLTGPNAEKRWLDYSRNVTESKTGKAVQIHLSREDRETPLQRNHTYLGYAKKVKDGIATLNETLYVRELQLVRKNIVREWVKKHLEKVAID